MIFKRIGSGIGVYDKDDYLFGVIMRNPKGQFWWKQNCHNAKPILAMDLVEIAKVMDELDGKH